MTKEYSSTKPQKRRSLRPNLCTMIVLLSTPVWTLPLIGATNPGFSSGFESGFSGWKQLQLCCKHSGQIASSPTRAGEHAAKFTLKKGDLYMGDRPRAEIRLDPVPANSEWVYKFSTFVDASYKTDPSYEVIAQWWNRPDPGEEKTIPPLGLVIENDRFRVGNRSDANPVTPNRGGERDRWDLGPITKGKWIDWTFHVKWSYKSDGLLEVWKDGKLVIKKIGPNTYNNRIGPLMKIGIYKPQWKENSARSVTTERVIYFDAVQVRKQ